MNPLASVILFSRSGADTLPRVLEGLCEQIGVDFEFEVILVYSGDARGVSAAKAFTHRLPLEIVVQVDPLTPGAARNVGIEKSRGSYVLFLEDDCIPDSGWLSKHVQRHREGFSVVAEAVTCASPRTIPARLQWLTRFSGSVASSSPSLGATPMSRWSYDRSLLVSGFDEELPLSEDVAFNSSLIQRGISVLFDPTIKVSHIGLQKTGDVFRHHYAHGAAAARLLERPETRWLAERYRRPLLALWYPFARLITTFLKVRAGGVRTTLSFVLLTPLALLAYGAWAVGFNSTTRAAQQARLVART